MTTFHIHIKGLVQGVGFRPYVYRLAKQYGIKGWVNNSSNGVHIMASAEAGQLEKFYNEVLADPPANAIITYSNADKVPGQQFNEFYIQASGHDKQPDLLIPPDFGLCDECRQELFDPTSRRYRYPFITCTNCGPRYSIITGLPYDRASTTMEPFDQCWRCRDEFHDPANRRYFSQTNSCPDCGIPMYLYDKTGTLVAAEYEEILLMTKEALSEGKTVAVKGIGGYLLMCDATDSNAIKRLRTNKQRPTKPFALLYPDINAVEQDVLISEVEKEYMTSVASPIVLCTVKEKVASGICTGLIAPGLNKVGIMLPYSPLLALIASDFGKPLIATSGNVTGSPIYYTDKEAVADLKAFADYLLVYEREIVVPQDDSVIQFTNKHKTRIILRRSRGYAPNYLNPPFPGNVIPLLAMGAEIKGSFALLNENRCYISQYLGDQANYESQRSFDHTLDHLTSVLNFDPEKILIDKHPAYYVSEKGRELGEKQFLKVIEVQHHKAHFAAVLAENDLLDTEEPVLGVIWDGTGFGDDNQIWGSEFFMYEKGDVKRISHLEYFPVISGDKMSVQPRLSALSLAFQAGISSFSLEDRFTENEWEYYNRQANIQTVLTSGMGRFIDAVACILDLCDKSNYEGEAAMLLEALASRSAIKTRDYYSFELKEDHIDWRPVLHGIAKDLQTGLSNIVIANKLHRSLARLVLAMVEKTGVTKVAFSGGVMQNALLIDMLIDELKDQELYFHEQLSPNDENISFGQLSYLYTKEKLEPEFRKEVSLLN